jgi:hypothetical protein
MALQLPGAYARFEGAEFRVSRGADGGLTIATGDGATAERLGFPRVDKYLWEIEVTLGDPRLEVAAHREPWDPSVVSTEQQER